MKKKIKKENKENFNSDKRYFTSSNIFIKRHNKTHKSNVNLFINIFKFQFFLNKL